MFDESKYEDFRAKVRQGHYETRKTTPAHWMRLPAERVTEMVEERDRDQAQLTARFKEDLLVAVQLDGHPKADRVMKLLGGCNGEISQVVALATARFAALLLADD